MTPTVVAAHGKCILFGEHAVVRGKRALVTPLRSRSLTLTHTAPAESGSTWQTAGPLAEPTRLCLEALGKSVPAGTYHVASDIPSRAGLGSSAALSVALCRFLLSQGALEGDLFAHALQLENLFHGQSSGIDIAAVSLGEPLSFRRGEAPQPLALRWRPRWYLSDTGLRSATKACVEKVLALARPDLDERMEAAAFAAETLLTQPRTEKSEAKLATAVEEGAAIFREWGLVPREAEETIARALTDGAIAAKPTGSGDGGFVLSLWRAEAETPTGYIPVD